tara:strand:+ start:758 stop:1138 length:381 start_codon:yes stop_codon:yes gene_type:complete
MSVHDQIARVNQLLSGRNQTNIHANDDLEKFVNLVRQWHHDRNLIEGASDKDQFCKLMQEAGELSDNICKGKDISDDIGDMMVVLINIAERNNLTLKDCLMKAWDDIKDRKGKMVDGVFIKEADLS